MNIFKLEKVILNMAEASAESLEGLLGVLGGILTANEIKIIINQAQEQCLQNGASNVLSMHQNFNPQAFGYFPAIAITQQVSSGTGNDVSKIARQGVVIRTTDTGDWFYIGGISGYWITSSNITVYQGGKAFFGTRFGASIRDAFLSSASGGIAIIPLTTSNPPEPWYNPPLFKGCSGFFGGLVDWVNSIANPGVVIYSYGPQIRQIASISSVITIPRRSIGGGFRVSRSFMFKLQGISNDYPFVYVGIMNGSSYCIAEPSIYTVTSACANNVMPSGYCTIAKSLLNWNDMELGTPIFSSFSCNPVTGGGCSEYGLIGLNYGISALNIPGFNIMRSCIFKESGSIGFMNGYTFQDIQNLANFYGIGNLFNQLLDAYNKMKKAIASLSATYPMFIAIASALAVVWTDVEYDQGLQQAEQKAKELQNMYNNVVNQLAGKPPSITDRYLYDEWYEYKIRVENCARQIIGENPDITYDELINEVQNCAGLPWFA